MAKYITKQRSELLSFLEKKAGSHVTVNEIMDHFTSLNIQIGLTTIYRHLNKMVEQGTVKKFYIDSKLSSCFKYLPAENTDNRDDRFHLKCKECDRLINFKCDEVKSLQNHLIAEHGFTIDPVRTVFYGICKDCKRKEK
ncbi:MAG TPA: transcriptional repressor [Candidatus Eisenbacteria bacterium]|nr:transcriptional repressor [Candidatus Eisenbacteria bacterium]